MVPLCISRNYRRDDTRQHVNADALVEERRSAVCPSRSRISAHRATELSSPAERKPAPSEVEGTSASVSAAPASRDRTAVNSTVEERRFSAALRDPKVSGFSPCGTSRGSDISRLYFAFEKSSTANNCPPRSTTPTPIESISESKIFARCIRRTQKFRRNRFHLRALANILRKRTKPRSRLRCSRRHSWLSGKSMLRIAMRGHHPRVFPCRNRQFAAPPQRQADPAFPALDSPTPTSVNSAWLAFRDCTAKSWIQPPPRRSELHAVLQNLNPEILIVCTCRTKQSVTRTLLLREPQCPSGYEFDVLSSHWPDLSALRRRRRLLKLRIVHRNILLHLAHLNREPPARPRQRPAKRNLDSARILIIVVINLRGQPSQRSLSKSHQPHQQSGFLIKIKFQRRFSLALPPLRDKRRGLQSSSVPRTFASLTLPSSAPEIAGPHPSTPHRYRAHASRVSHARKRPSHPSCPSNAVMLSPSEYA